MTTFLVEVARRDPAADPAAAHLLEALRAAGHDVAGVRLAEVYALEPVTAERAEALGRELLADPVLDAARVVPGDDPRGGADPGPGEEVLTILRRDGVMDPVALSTVFAARDLSAELERVRTGHRLYVRGPAGPPAEAALAFLERRLANPVVDRVLRGATPLPQPAAAAAESPVRREVPLAGLSAEALVALSRERTLALDAVEMTAVRDHFEALERHPTELELETIAQTWSEHCKHKTLTGPIDYVELDPGGAEVERTRIENLLKETVFAATKQLDLDRCLSVFVDNAGVIRFDDAQGVAVKVETHNHPSAIEPYGGAGTGIGGVIRDILGTGLGARPVLNVDVFCVGDLDADPEGLPPGSIHPRPLLAGVVAGVRDYGNRMGIPTVCGALVTEPRYAGNPLVYAGTVGLIPNERVAKAPRPGDWIVAVGGRTGRDGIHGATFSSDALTSESETQSGGAVQIGNPIEEKKLADVLLEVRDRGWVHAVTDCGAGGFSSAVGEMAEGLGATVELERAPLKYEGLAPWEVWISEAQERMVLAVPPERGPDVIAAFAAEDVEATHLGEFADSGRLVIRWRGEVTGDLDLGFLHDGLPKQVRAARWVQRVEEPFAAAPGAEPGALLRRILGEPTVASKEQIIRQYDHEVQGASALKPLVGVAVQGPQDGVAVAPVPGSPRGVVVGLGLNPRHGDGDPYAMALGAVDEALRNAVACGCDPDTTGVLDNFSWGDCRRAEELGSMVRAARGCRDAALAYRVPFISGKDSLNNEYELPSGERVAIPPTLLVTAVGVVDDVGRLVSMDLKAAGGAVYLVGATRPGELLGSMLAAAGGGRGGRVPSVDLARAPGVLRRVHRALATGGVRACHDLSEGGLAVAAAEMAFAGGLGLDLALAGVPTDDGAPGDSLGLLFAETPTRFLLEVEPSRTAEVEEALGDAPWARVGEVTAEPRLRVRGPDGDALDEPLDGLLAAWREPLFAAYP